MRSYVSLPEGNTVGFVEKYPTMRVMTAAGCSFMGKNEDALKNPPVISSDHIAF